MSVWPWASTSKRREKIDCGGGLYKLPEQAVDRDDDTGELLPVWAANQWDMWRSGRSGWHIGADNEISCCPYCYALKGAANAWYMAHNHSDRAARRRWTFHTHKNELKAEELGGCRCDVKLTRERADDLATQTLGRYQF